jgi:hypothetical protein
MSHVVSDNFDALMSARRFQKLILIQKNQAALSFLFLVFASFSGVFFVAFASSGLHPHGAGMMLPLGCRIIPF